MRKVGVEEWKDLVASLGCWACMKGGIYGTPAEIHHIRDGNGISQRSSDYLVIPLCPIHHRIGDRGIAFHAGPRTYRSEFRSEREAVDDVVELVKYRYGVEPDW